MSARMLGLARTVLNRLLRPLGATPTTNILPNVQWQMWTGLNYITSQNEAGTASQTAVSVSAFSTANNAPVLTAANTQAVKAGDLLLLSGGGFQWGYTGVGYVATAVSNRVASVTPNVSIQLAASALGGVTPVVSVAITATPITPGDLGSGTGQAADGWKKTTTLSVWADDWSSNQCVGAIRVMGIRKSAGTAQILTWTPPAYQVPKYKGQTITFGVLVRQKVMSGAGTWRAYISDDVTGTTYSASGTGSGYSSATYGGFEFLSVTATISSTAATLTVGISFDGASADVYYVALPTAVFGSELAATGCRQNVNDLLRPVTHWNPPLLTPLAMTFPSVALPNSGGLLYGYTAQDIEAMSMGQMHKSVAAVKCKIEVTTATAGDNFLTGSAVDANGSLIFGPQAVVQANNRMNVDSGWLPLAEDGSCTLFCASAGVVLANVTFDFDMVQLAMANAKTS